MAFLTTTDTGADRAFTIAAQPLELLRRELENRYYTTRFDRYAAAMILIDEILQTLEGIGADCATIVYNHPEGNAYYLVSDILSRQTDDNCRGERAISACIENAI